MTPETDLLAQSFVDHCETPGLASGQFGAPLSSLLSLDVAANFARFIESLLAKQLGPAFEAVVAADHDQIALFFSPDLADLIAKAVDKFGTAHS
jgi:hypothetical protein